MGGGTSSSSNYDLSRAFGERAIFHIRRRTAVEAMWRREERASSRSKHSPAFGVQAFDFLLRRRTKCVEVHYLTEESFEEEKGWLVAEVMESKAARTRCVGVVSPLTVRIRNYQQMRSCFVASVLMLPLRYEVHPSLDNQESERRRRRLPLAMDLQLAASTARWYSLST